MNKGTMGLKPPSLGGRSMRGGDTSIGGGSSSGAPSPINTGSLGRRVVNMLRGRRQARRSTRKL